MRSWKGLSGRLLSSYPVPSQPTGEHSPFFLASESLQVGHTSNSGQARLLPMSWCESAAHTPLREHTRTTGLGSIHSVAGYMLTAELLGAVELFSEAILECAHRWSRSQRGEAYCPFSSHHKPDPKPQVPQLRREGTHRGRGSEEGDLQPAAFLTPLWPIP